MLHIPVEKLPADIQKQVIDCLQAEDFVAAKHIRDEYERRLHNGRQKPSRHGHTKSSLTLSKTTVPRVVD